MTLAIILLVLACVPAGILALLSIKNVPAQNAWVVERLGRYQRTLAPGLNLLLPFIDRVAYKHSLQESRIELPSQHCSTKDNTPFQVGGILYFQVIDPARASYGSSNYSTALTQLAQASLQGEIGKLDKGNLFYKEHGLIAARVMQAIDEGALNLGLKVLRLEIKD